MDKNQCWFLNSLLVSKTNVQLSEIILYILLWTVHFLGNLREGRRYPGLTTIGNHLYVLGGETFNDHGQRHVLDSMEALLGQQWVPLREKLPEKRSRFAMIRIPQDYFWTF